MRARLAVLLTVAGVISSFLRPAAAQTLLDQPFRAYTTGTALSVNALQLGTSQVAGVQAAHSGATAGTPTLNGALTNELGQNVQPASDRNAYGRGTGLEVGLLTPIPQEIDVNQLLLSGLAEAFAPPPTDLVVETIDLDLSPLLRAQTLQGEAQAIFDPNFCTLGKPISYGRGFAENLEILNPGAALIGTTFAGRNVSTSRSVTYLRPNGDGTFAVVSETRQTIAPVSIGNLPGGLAGLNIELAGEFIFRAIATGKPDDPQTPAPNDGARIEYPGTPVITVRSGASTLITISLQDLLGQDGLELNVPLLANLALGTPPHAIGQPGVPPVIAADGTAAAAAVDAVLLQLLPIPGLTLTDLRLGHMEAAVTAPAGGVRCNIPIDKIGEPDPVQVGQEFTITIRIPSSTEVFERLFGCDLIGIRAVDFHTVESGSARFVLTGADRGGQISADGTTVTWENLGDYRIGDPPIELKVFGRIPGNSGPGVLKDTVTVDASLGNCRGTGSGEDIVGQAIGFITNRAVTGTFTLIGPDVGGGALAPTGGQERGLLLGGGLLLVAAVTTAAVRRRLRRAPASPTG